MRLPVLFSSLPVALWVTRLDDDLLGGDRVGPLMPVGPAEAGRGPLSRWTWAIREVSAR